MMKKLFVSGLLLAMSSYAHADYYGNGDVWTCSDCYAPPPPAYTVQPNNRYDAYTEMQTYRPRENDSHEYYYEANRYRQPTSCTVIGNAVYCN